MALNKEILTVPGAAARNLIKADIDSFLLSGLIMGVGPERCVVAWGKATQSKVPKPDQLQFYVPDFYMQNPKPWVSFESVVVVERDRLISDLAEFAAIPMLDLAWREPQFSDFSRQFQIVKEAIRKGEIRKAVPVSFSLASGTMTKSRRANLIRNLLQKSTKTTPFGYWNENEGIMGSTPEILFSYKADEGVLETMALAGTRDSKREKTNSLSCDPKEIFEHDLVVRGLREKLVPFGELQISPTYVWDLGAISHLRTDMSVDFAEPPKADSMFSEFCKLLHPTAALGVSPMSADWRFLKQCDGTMDRQRFGAPFGVLSPTGRSTALVAIRNVQWFEDRIMMGSGCGVVEQSELENEWQELELKRKTIRTVMGL